MTNDTHIVKSYGEELQFLNDSIIQMGSLTESLLADSMNAITILDKEAVSRIIQSDKKINEYRTKLDTQIMTFLVKRAPMAIDLRIGIKELIYYNFGAFGIKPEAHFFFCDHVCVSNLSITFNVFSLFGYSSLSLIDINAIYEDEFSALASFGVNLS